MIDKAITLIKDKVNAYLKLKADITEDKVAINNILSQEGSTSHLPENSILLTLVNIEEDRILTNTKDIYKEVSDDRISKVNPPVHLNLYLLFSANFSEDNYIEAIKFLSYLIGFFQAYPVFNHQNSSELNENIEKLILDLYNMNFEHQNHLWGTLGAKYMPSVMYKVRLVTIQEDNVVETRRRIVEIERKMEST